MSKRSGRVHKSVVTAEMTEHVTTQKRGSVQLFMECVDEDLAPSQKEAGRKAETEYQKAVQRVASAQRCQADTASTMSSPRARTSATTLTTTTTTAAAATATPAATAGAAVVAGRGGRGRGVSVTPGRGRGRGRPRGSSVAMRGRGRGTRRRSAPAALGKRQHQSNNRTMSHL